MNLTVEQLRALIEDVIANLGDSMRPGGLNALPGFDPDYETNPLRQAHTLTTDGSATDGESEFPINAGETKHFRYTMNNKTPNGVYGVVISTPAGIKDESSAMIISVINGKIRARAMTDAGDFNRSVGRFNTGQVVVEGTIENGPQPGMVKMAYGAPEAESDLGLDKENSLASLITGNETITLPKAGRYVVTWLVEES